jgi:electron transport complex protein RnfG
MNKILTSTFLLGLFALIGTGIVAYTFKATKSRIELNKLADQLRRLNEILPKDAYDNDLAKDSRKIPPSTLLGTKRKSTIYRARKNGKPVAVFLTPVAPDGYNGDISLLVGIYADGTIAGVRHVSHNETPGLGDAVDIRKSKWIKSFDNKSLKNPVRSKWAVKKDGGVFDQFTGATITPRAVVKAVHRALQYYEIHKQELFTDPVPKKSKGKQP